MSRHGTKAADKEVDPSDFGLCISRLKHSPTSSAGSINLWEVPEHIPEIPESMSPQQTGNYAAPQAGDRYGFQYEPLQLNEMETVDMAIIRHCPDVKRYNDAINAFVSRGFSARSDEGSPEDAALRYYFRLSREFQQQGLSSEKTEEAHNAMVCGWQKRVAAKLASTVCHEGDLSGILDDIITHAEMTGSTLVAPDLKLALHNAVATTVDSGRTTQEPPLLNTPAQDVSQRLCHQPPPENSDAQMLDEVAPKEGPNLVLPSSTEQKPSDTQALIERYSDRWRFFKHHAMRAKRRLRKAMWHQEQTKEAAKDEARAEFDKMDMQTAAAWADLIERLTRGDVRVLKHAATAHLFEDGHPVSLWTSGIRASCARSITASSTDGASSRLGATSRKSDRRRRESEHEEPPRPPPRRAPFDPVRLLYNPIDNPDRTLFLQLPPNVKVTAQQVIRACCNAIGPRQLSPNSFEYSTMREQNLCVLRLSDLKTARMLAHKNVRIKGKANGVRAWPYPEAAPQVFVGNMVHGSLQGIRVDAIPPSIAQAIPKIPFHIRREPIVSTTDTTWIIVFKRPVRFLRFGVGIQKHDGKHTRIQFDPVIPSSACPVCQRAHLATECDLLEAATREELGIDPESTSYLDEIPKMKRVK